MSKKGEVYFRTMGENYFQLINVLSDPHPPVSATTHDDTIHRTVKVKYYLIERDTMRVNVDNAFFDFDPSPIIHILPVSETPSEKLRNFIELIFKVKEIRIF